MTILYHFNVFSNIEPIKKYVLIVADLMSLKNDWKLFGTDGENLNSSVSKSYQDSTSISSDTSGSLLGRLKEESLTTTVCKWNGCFEDQGSLSNLIHHLYHVHIVNIGSVYICQWDGCSRKGITYISRFAFVMHLRSHTGGKSFFCRVPECNKSFLRFDSLIKHTKVVHDLNFLHSSTFSSFIQDSYVKPQFIVNKDIEDPYMKEKGKSFDNKKSFESDQNDLSDWSEDEIGMSFYDLSKFLKQKLCWIKEENQVLKNKLFRIQNKCKKYYIQKESAFEKLLIKSLGKDAAATIIR
ncbi:hypothetical protein PCK1_001728 [Pneumocystis canis]|nr:hypothetical protein PCK1_001728 [Pneumocystis canis]